MKYSGRSRGVFVRNFREPPEILVEDALKLIFLKTRNCSGMTLCKTTL